MAATFTLVKHDLDGNNFNSPKVHIEGLFNFGDSYAAVSKADLLALVKAALVAVRSDYDVTSIDSVIIGNSANGALFTNYDAANAQLEAQMFTAPSLTVPTLAAWSAELTVTSHKTTVALAAGLIPIAVDATAADTGDDVACPMVSHTTPESHSCNFDPATRFFEFAAADAVTKCKVLCINPGSLAAGGMAAAAGDVSAAAYNCPISLVCTK